MDPITSLTLERIVVESVEWTQTVVRTGGPSGPRHDEWSLSIRVRCDTPARGMAFLDVDGRRWHERDWARRAERTAELRVSFQPYDWHHSDMVQIITNGGGIQCGVESAALKLDPVASTRVDVEVGTSGLTGVPLSILGVQDVGASLGVLLLSSTDTKADRTRWRVRDEHIDSLGEFSFLATGGRSGRADVTTPRR